MDFSTSFKEDSDMLRRIVKRGATPIAPFEKLSLRIFCQSPKVSALIMKNSTVVRKTNKETETNVVYHFRCSVDACQRRTSDYIGLTTQTLRNRLGQHRYNGAINAHFTSKHDRLPKIDELIANTTVTHRENVKSRLFIAEAMFIEVRKPTLNVQMKFDYVLPSCRSRINHEHFAANGPTGDATSSNEDQQRNEAAPRAASERVRRLRPLPHRV